MFSKTSACLLQGPSHQLLLTHHRWVLHRQLLLLILIDQQGVHQILVLSEICHFELSSTERTLGDVFGTELINTFLADTVVAGANDNRSPVLGVETDNADLADNISLGGRVDTALLSSHSNKF